MNYNLKTLAIGAVCLCLQPLSTQAQGVPVYDNTSYIKTLEQLIQLKKQVEAAEKQLEASTGSRNLGDLLNDVTNSEARHYMPSSINDLITMQEQGLLPPSTAGVQGSYNQLHNTYQPLTPEQINPSNPNYPTAKAYEHSSNTSFATMAASEQTYNNTNLNLQNYESMLQQINGSEDLKTSIDLLARISVENGIRLNEMLRMQALQMQLMGAKSSSVLAWKKAEYDANKKAGE